jgi:hypothetical protein
VFKIVHHTIKNVQETNEFNQANELHVFVEAVVIKVFVSVDDEVDEVVNDDSSTEKKFVKISKINFYKILFF